MIRVIITDIEGTTTSKTFEREVLLPYAARHMASFVRENSDQPEVRDQLERLAAEVDSAPSQLENLINHLDKRIQEESDDPALRALQGLIWEKGYQAGDFKGSLYPDAADYLLRWHDRGLRNFTFSSWSVKGQRELLQYSEQGDLTPVISDFFDTRIGGKRSADSYTWIRDQIGMELDVNWVLYLSNEEEELAAAERAGMRTCWIVRHGPLPRTERPVARTFEDVDALVQAR